LVLRGVFTITMGLQRLQLPLHELVKGLQIKKPPFKSHVVVSGIALDSRKVKPGYLFVALTGLTDNGHQFIEDAIQRGAVAVVGSQPDLKLPVPYFQVSDGRWALAHLSAKFHGYPARHLTVIGVTGTDGKTTTANLIYHLLKHAGFKVGMISTVNAIVGEEILDTGFHVTTPEAPDIQKYLAQMVASRLSHVVIEATSHGLSQQRVEACEFDIGVVTNITHEHLDYHRDYESYRAAKGRLFKSLNETQPKKHSPPRAAILNRDDSSFEYLSENTLVRKISYGSHLEADLRVAEVNLDKQGISFILLGRDYQIPIRTNLLGEYNIANCLAAFATVVEGLGIEPGEVQPAFVSFDTIPGRMERIDLGQQFLAIVDFAHTPNALRCALETARKIVSGRVVAIFGSAGLRDREKRRLMAEISADLADISVLTAEDPRTESLEVILAEMASGALSRGGVEGETFWRIPDRGEAIRFGVGIAKPDDIVIVCGKGHEQSMCFGKIEYDWDDRVALKAAISEVLNIDGPKMPYLPTQDQFM
jgi:UDP-N-acetylmuramoyl-L-alanyl-D-glutamate--2,6-diaminopimelate ligase